MHLRRLVVVVALVTAGGWPLPSAEARPIEQFRYHEAGSFVLDDLCSDLQINVEFDDVGHVLGRVTGPDGALRYTVTGRVSSTWTNLATGRAMTFSASHVAQDVRATVHDDGTVSILVHDIYSERALGPDGRFVYVEGGITEMLVVLDYGGTLTDPSDDTFVSETFISQHGAKPGNERDFCEDFRTLTALDEL